MTGTTAACGHGALYLPPHGRKTSGAPAGSAAATRRYRTLCPCAHGRKTTWPAVKGAPSFGSDLPPPPRTHSGEPTRTAMKRTPAQRCDFTLLFGVHRRETAPSMACRIFFMPPPAPRRVMLFQKIKSVGTPWRTTARGNFPLPSCPCHKLPSLSLATEIISIASSLTLAGYMPASKAGLWSQEIAASVSVEFCKVTAKKLWKRNRHFYCYCRDSP